MIIVGINKPLQIVEMVTWKKKNHLLFFLLLYQIRKEALHSLFYVKKKP